MWLLADFLLHQMWIVKYLVKNSTIDCKYLLYLQDFFFRLEQKQYKIANIADCLKKSGNSKTKQIIWRNTRWNIQWNIWRNIWQSIFDGVERLNYCLTFRVSESVNLIEISNLEQFSTWHQLLESPRGFLGEWIEKSLYALTLLPL